MQCPHGAAKGFPSIRENTAGRDLAGSGGKAPPNAFPLLRFASGLQCSGEFSERSAFAATLLFRNRGLHDGGGAGSAIGIVAGGGFREQFADLRYCVTGLFIAQAPPKVGGGVFERLVCLDVLRSRRSVLAAAEVGLKARYRPRVLVVSICQQG